MRKLITGAVAVAVCGALGLTGTATAGGGAPTTVTIKGGGEVYGTVKSPKPNKCANGRKVLLYKQQGNQQDHGDDPKVGEDTAQPNNNEYQWNAGNPGNGKFYARVRKIDGCQGDFSKTVNG